MINKIMELVDTYAHERSISESSVEYEYYRYAVVVELQRIMIQYREAVRQATLDAAQAKIAEVGPKDHPMVLVTNGFVEAIETLRKV